MNFTKISSVVLAFVMVWTGRNAHAEGEREAGFFIQTYFSICAAAMIDPSAMRMQFNPLPKLSAEDARYFLAGHPGDAWAFPYNGKIGNFVLVLTSAPLRCALYARRLDIKAAASAFDGIFSHPFGPVEFTKQAEVDANSPVNRKAQTVSYTQKTAKKTTLFTMTTFAAADAQVQAVASMTKSEEEQPAKTAYPSSDAQNHSSPRQ